MRDVQDLIILFKITSTPLHLGNIRLQYYLNYVLCLVLDFIERNDK